MNGLLNRRAVRVLILDTMRRTGREQFRRVSASYFDELGGRVRALVEDDCHRHPSRGMTVKALGYA